MGILGEVKYFYLLLGQLELRSVIVRQFISVPYNSPGGSKKDFVSSY
jgi:hypothetical protein